MLISATSAWETMVRVVVAVVDTVIVHYYGGRVEKFVMVKNEKERVESINGLSSLLEPIYG